MSAASTKSFRSSAREAVGPLRLRAVFELLGELLGKVELLRDERELDQSPGHECGLGGLKGFWGELPRLFALSGLDEQAGAPREPRNALLRISCLARERHGLPYVVERAFDVVSRQPDACAA